MIINLIIKINFKKEQQSFDRSTVIFMLRSQKLAWNGDYQKWSPTRRKGVSETNQCWAFTALQKPCWCEVQTFSAESLKRAFKLSSNLQFFHQECEPLKKVFARLYYPETLVKNTISRNFIETKFTENACLKQRISDELDDSVRIVLPFKDQKTPTQWSQSKDRCWCPACLHKSEDQRTIQTKGS